MFVLTDKSVFSHIQYFDFLHPSHFQTYKCRVTTTGISGRMPPKKTFRVIDPGLDSQDVLIRIWTIIRFVSIIILAIVLLAKTIHTGTVWKPLQCPRVNISNGMYKITCGQAAAETDGWIPLTAFPLVAVGLFLTWDGIKLVCVRVGIIIENTILRRTSPRNICYALVFPLLMPPILYFGVQPCLALSATFVALDAVIRWVWYAADRESNTFKAKMFYVVMSNIVKFFLIYSYFGYSERIPGGTKAYMWVDIAFTLVRVILAVLVGNRESAILEWVGSIIQHIQFIILTSLSAHVALIDVSEITA